MCRPDRKLWGMPGCVNCSIDLVVYFHGFSSSIPKPLYLCPTALARSKHSHKHNTTLAKQSMARTPESGTKGGKAMGGRGGGKKGPKSQKAGLQFPVGRIARFLKKGQSVRLLGRGSGGVWVWGCGVY